MKTNASLNRYLAVPFAVMLFMLQAFSSDNEYPDTRLNEAWRIRKTPVFDVLYPAEFQRNISGIMGTLSRSYARCSNLLRHKSSRVIRIIVCPGPSRRIPAGYPLPSEYYGETGNDVRIPFCSSDERLSSVCLYGMSQAMLSDFLSQGPVTASVPEWLREGVARYAAFGMDREALSFLYSRMVHGRWNGVAGIGREPGPLVRACLARAFLHYLDSSFEAGAVSRFFGQMRQGKGFAGSIEAACGISFDEFNRCLVAFYEKKRGDVGPAPGRGDARACAACPDDSSVSVPLYVNETGRGSICLERGVSSCA
ncbi:MAG TPA: hypothetical protein PK926_16920, partial [Spirochaetota bacterium]|nr:hypothetical protein [Spirochaetota bacterium]